MSTPLHFKREDEGGAAHTVSNGTSLVGANGFGRPRRQIPGAELAENHLPPGAAPVNTVPGADTEETLSKAALKNKKKREAKKAKEAEAKAAAAGQGLTPDGPGGANNYEQRGSERRDRPRSRSKSNAGSRATSQQRNRSNTHQANRHISRMVASILQSQLDLGIMAPLTKHQPNRSLSQNSLLPLREQAVPTQRNCEPCRRRSVPLRILRCV